MYYPSLIALGLVAGAPLVHADPDGENHQAVATNTEFDDSRFFSIWSSFLRSQATVTVTGIVTVISVTTLPPVISVTTLPASTTTMTQTEPVFTIGPITETETEAPTTDLTSDLTSSEPVVPHNVRQFTTAAPYYPIISPRVHKLSVPPTKNSTTSTSTQSKSSTTTTSTTTTTKGRPTKTPPPIGGPIGGGPANAAPMMGAVAVAIAGCIVML
ncbi:hypothetical protein ACQKWADRAFT_306560 [Trichoderma austrokoningii]